MKKNIVVAASALALLCSSSAFADEKQVSVTNIPIPEPGWSEIDVGARVSPMRKNQCASFTGVLFSPKAVADVIATYKNMDQLVKVEVDRATAEANAKAALEIANVKSTANAEKSIANAQLKEKDAQIRQIEEQLKKTEQSRPSPTLWFGLGFAGGVAVTVATVFVVSAATK